MKSVYQMGETQRPSCVTSYISANKAEGKFMILRWFAVSDLKIMGICRDNNYVKYEIGNNYMEAVWKFSVSFTFMAVRVELLVLGLWNLVDEYDLKYIRSVLFVDNG